MLLGRNLPFSLRQKSRLKNVNPPRSSKGRISIPPEFNPELNLAGGIRGNFAFAQADLYIKENLSFGNSSSEILWKWENVRTLWVWIFITIQISACCSAEFLHRINFRFIAVRSLTTKWIADHVGAICLRVHFISASIARWIDNKLCRCNKA